ncbi:diguanylate cyclase [Kineobactrum sediminis]|uniref:Diguanylate cyclase n=1 Tax=Kineobactrum sediminis TaxID=1905677 RepID=A0A2N5Y5Q1_9GAMM|nr:EAL domain-containing protein [Kineobactrum sediminis]PLW83702.1 diguanylate cyclase [Kineobactrum sediminis]
MSIFAERNYTACGKAVLFVLGISLPWPFIATVFAEPATSLRVGVYTNPPKIQLDNKQLSGIFGELLREIATRENWALEPVACSWNTCLTLLEEGHIDLMPDVAKTQAREQDFSFHQTPVLRSWSQLYSSSKARVSSLLDLDRLRIAVLDGSVQQEYLGDLVAGFGLDVAWLPTVSFEDGFTAVENGHADVVAANYLFGDRRASDLGLSVTPIMFQPSRLYFAGRPNLDPQILATIDRYLDRWMATSASPYGDIMRRWGVHAQQATVPMWVYWAAPVALGILVLALGFAIFQHRRTARATSILNLSEQRFDTILNGIDAYVYTKDTHFRYQYLNERLCELLGVSKEDVLGQTDEVLFDENSCRRMRAHDARVLERGERVSGEEVNTTRLGAKRTFMSIKIPLRDAEGNIYGICGVSTDITEQQRIREQLDYAQYYDGLTGLANRKMLLDRLDHAVAGYSRTGFEGAVLALDLNDFTMVNDTLGHGVGDDLLKLVAMRASSCLSESDSAARLGADDFVIILENLSDDREAAVMHARYRAEELLEAISLPCELDGNTLSTSVSIGVTLFSDGDPEQVSSLLRNADLALVEAKRQDTGAVRFFDPTMQDHVTRRMDIEAALRRALGMNSLELYLQPQVNAQCEVVGGEILLRWNDPVLGVMSPDEFIPVAESTGLIIPLGSWVLREACKILQEWQASPLLANLSLAVNISPRQFRHAEFVQHVEQCISEFDLRGELIELEITEGMLIDDFSNIVVRMEELQAMGVRFSLDDFGTGYASLSYLKRLSLFQLKIDQSFTRDLLTDPNDEAIVTATLSLGSSLGLEVIAEGVETSAQMQRLTEMGCQKFQGYYIGRPQPVEEWQSRLRDSLSLKQDQEVS